LEIKALDDLFDKYTKIKGPHSGQIEETEEEKKEGDNTIIQFIEDSHDSEGYQVFWGESVEYHVSLSFNQNYLKIVIGDANFSQDSNIAFDDLEHLDTSAHHILIATKDGFVHEEAILMIVKKLVGAKSLVNMVFSLTFSCSKCNQLGDGHLFLLGELIQKCKNLTYISLNFGGCAKITDKGFIELTKSISKLNNLFELGLDFKFCPITDEGLITAGEYLAKMLSMTTITLDLSGNSLISDKGMVIFSEYISKLPGLENISISFSAYFVVPNRDSLHFENNTAITDQGILLFSRNLANMVDLKQISLDLQGCTKLTSNGVEEVKNGFKEETTVSIKTKDLSALAPLDVFF
jgi:hypothetical protein